MSAATSPRLFPGRLCAENIGAVDWSRGLVAYGCQCYVVVVSPRSLELVQTLDEHHAPITAVQWSRQTHTATVAQNELLLASADASGAIVVWNVRSALGACTQRSVVVFKRKHRKKIIKTDSVVSHSQ